MQRQTHLAVVKARHLHLGHIIDVAGEGGAADALPIHDDVDSVWSNLLWLELSCQLAGQLSRHSNGHVVSRG